MSVTKFALIAWLLFAHAPAWAVEFGITRPAALGSEQQSYFERPDILQVEAREHPELRWQTWRQAHLEAAAAFLELYPTEHLYFLARDAELLYDAVRFISRDDPQTLVRLHLLNVSRANMRHTHLLQYLAQEGITVERLRTDSSFQPIFIDTGFSGTIPRVIAERMPDDVRARLKTHLLTSSNPAMPSLRSFLLPINPAINSTSPSSMHGTIVGYEHIARATDRSNAYQQLGGEWHPVSSAHSRSDGEVSTLTARQYQEDLKAYLQRPETTATLQARRELWRELRTNWLTLSKEEWTELLKSKLENAGDARPQTEAAIRDFLEWARLIGIVGHPNSPIISNTAIGLETESGAQLSNKSKLIADYPQWAPILENPDTEIPALLDSGQVSTLGAILDVIEDGEIRRISMQAIAERLATPQTYSLAEALAEHIESKPWFMQLFWIEKTAQHPGLVRIVIEKASSALMYAFIQEVLRLPQWSQHPELLRLAIENTSAEQMSTFSMVFGQEHWASHPELLRLAIERASPNAMFYFAVRTFSQQYWSNHPEILRLAIEKSTPDNMQSFISYAFSYSHWGGHPELLRLAIERSDSLEIRPFIDLLLEQVHWINHPQTYAFRAASQIHDPDQRRAYLREQLGPYPWENETPGVCEQQMIGGGST